MPADDIALAAQIGAAAHGGRLRIHAHGDAAGVHAIGRENALHVAAGAQRVLYGDSDAALDVELRRCVGMIFEGTVRMVGVDPRPLDSDWELLMKDDDVEQNVQHLLILAVAARRTQRENRFSVFAH